MIYRHRSLYKINLQAQESKTYYTMQEALAAKEKVYSLYLSDKNVSDSLLVRIGELSQLKSLYLTKNKEIKSLPKGFLQLKKLEVLYIRQCKNLLLPDHLYQLKNLRHLVLEEMNLVAVPTVVSQLLHLEFLALNSNNLQELPSRFHRLSQLKHLHLEANDLKEFPSVINKLRKLETLHLSYNSFETSPVFSKKLSALKEVVLFSSDLQEFPITLLALPALQEVNLGYNPIHFPTTFGQQTSPVREIRMVGCHLKEFPSALTELKQLESLNLKKNDIQVLPERAGAFVGLKKLDLSQNKLTTIEVALTFHHQLEDLNLSLNLLKQMPAVSEWKSLQKLNVAFCFLQQLPKGMMALDSLKVADFKYNELQEVPRALRSKFGYRLVTVGNSLQKEKDRIYHSIQATKDTMIDPRDQQKYPTITLNGATWMTKHLNYVTSLSIPDTLQENNGRKYLVTEYNNVCPANWHTATEKDWRAVVNFVSQTFEKDYNAYENRRTADERVPYGEAHEDITRSFNPNFSNEFGYIGTLFVNKHQTELLFRAKNVNFLGLNIRARAKNARRRRPSFMYVYFPALTKDNTWNFFKIFCQSSRCSCEILNKKAESFKTPLFVRCVKDK
ncbi:MAG: leucine-rich repeat domain-containing protein [Aureispira sp.]